MNKKAKKSANIVETQLLLIIKHICLLDRWEYLQALSVAREHLELVAWACSLSYHQSGFSHAILDYSTPYLEIQDKYLGADVNEKRLGQSCL